MGIIIVCTFTKPNAPNAPLIHDVYSSTFVKAGSQHLSIMRFDEGRELLENIKRRRCDVKTYR